MMARSAQVQVAAESNETVTIGGDEVLLQLQMVKFRDGEMGLVFFDNGSTVVIIRNYFTARLSLSLVVKSFLMMTTVDQLSKKTRPISPPLNLTIWSCSRTSSPPMVTVSLDSAATCIWAVLATKWFTRALVEPCSIVWWLAL